MHRIKPIGRYLEISSDGYILNDCHLDNIGEKWMAPVNDLISYYENTHQSNLHSVYLRGSVPRGTMIDSISDVDSFCITHSEINEHTKQEEHKHQLAISQNYDFVNGVEIDSSTLNWVLSESIYMPFLLKTQCLCVAGNDISKGMESFRISEICFNTCLYLPDINDSFLRKLKRSKSEEALLDTCSWICKLALRAAFEIVLFRENKYTRDLYYCWHSYSKFYPEHANLFYEALHLAINPVPDRAAIHVVWESLYVVLQQSVDNEEHQLK